MTSKERWLAALKLQPVDRLPFWPKLDGAYARAQVEPFSQMNNDALHTWVGSDKHVGIAGCVREIRTDTSSKVHTEDGTQVTTFHTPHGDTRLVKKFDDASQSWHPVEFPVKDREDIRLMTEWYSDCQVELHEESLDRSRQQYEQIGQSAITCNGIGESPLMHWVEWLAGVANAHYLLVDYPDEVEALFDAMHRVLLRKTEILTANSAADIFYLVENTSTTLISPEQYRKYCYGHICAYGEIAQAYERLVVLHMCGYLKALFPYLSKLPVAGFEAFTSAPLANTSYLDGRMACPDKCLIGGTNAVLWTQTASEIIEQIEQDLDVLPHHRGLVVTSAGVMPPLCQPETIREVCTWVRNYPVKS